MRWARAALHAMLSALLHAHRLPVPQVGRSPSSGPCTEIEVTVLNATAGAAEAAADEKIGTVDNGG